MEGFPKELKFPDEADNRRILPLAGVKAKKAGACRFNGRTLYWKDMAIDRHGPELRRAYAAKYAASPIFRRALKSASRARIVHSVGASDPARTVRTEADFVSLLEELCRNT